MEWSKQMMETELAIWQIHDSSGELEDRAKLIESLAIQHLESAREAALKAYAPYSKFRVGASVFVSRKSETASFSGCNVENASYGATMCAERVAIFTAVSAGFETIDLIALSVLDAADQSELSQRSPCGLCRQVISEFATPETLIVIDGGKNEDGKNRGDITTIDTILPWRFTF